MNHEEQHHYMRGFHLHTFSKIHQPSTYSFTAQNGPGIFARAPAAAGHPFAGFRVALRQKKNCPHWIKLFKSTRLAISARLFFCGKANWLYLPSTVWPAVCVCYRLLQISDIKVQKRERAPTGFFLQQSLPPFRRGGGDIPCLEKKKRIYFIRTECGKRVHAPFSPFPSRLFFPLPPSPPHPIHPIPWVKGKKRNQTWHCSRQDGIQVHISCFPTKNKFKYLINRMTLCNIFIFFTFRIPPWLFGSRMPPSLSFFLCPQLFPPPPFFANGGRDAFPFLPFLLLLQIQFRMHFYPQPKNPASIYRRPPPPLHAADSFLETLFSPEFGGVFLAYTYLKKKMRSEELFLTQIARYYS